MTRDIYVEGLKFLRPRGMSSTKLKNIFKALLGSRLTYVLPSSRGLLSTDLVGRIDLCLCRAERSGPDEQRQYDVGRKLN